MVGFTQATGPARSEHKSHIYPGLHIDVVYLRTSDGGAHWEKIAKTGVNFTTPKDSGLGTHANNSPTTIALKDGSLIRRVYGWDYNDFAHLPGTAFMQLSTDGGVTWSPAPSTSDGGRTWSHASSIQEFLLDPNQYTVQPTRTRRLRDGRLLITGGVWNGPHTQSTPYEPLMMVSADEGVRWQRIKFTGPGWNESYNIKFNEWDVAELDNGDLLIITRPNDKAPRWQGLMTKAGDSWQVASFNQTAIPHSGHPELLKTQEGPVLHIATTGTLWSNDAGATWNPLRVDTLPDRDDGDYQSMYYPRSLQTADGWVYVFSHHGYDNYYGQVDQSIFMDKFRLVATNPTAK